MLVKDLEKRNKKKSIGVKENKRICVLMFKFIKVNILDYLIWG